MSVVFGIYSVVVTVISLGFLIWGIYIAFLLTKALRKYLRS